MFVVISTGVLLPAPYVDEYGECDEGLKRGNPLKLDKGMYEELNKVNHTHCQISFSIMYQPNSRSSIVYNDSFIFAGVAE